MVWNYFDVQETEKEIMVSLAWDDPEVTGNIEEITEELYLLRSTLDEDSLIYECLESFLCNSEYEFWYEDHPRIKQAGWLTHAPCLVEVTEVDEDDNLIYYEKVYVWNDYWRESFLKIILQDKESVVFRRVTF